SDTYNLNKKPWMFPRSKRLLGKKADSRIVESFLKEFFRTSTARIFYIQIVCISTASIIMTPRWIAAIVLVLLVVINNDLPSILTIVISLHHNINEETSYS
ncbi:ABC transporter permease, partial [Escherichia sp. TWPC-MK]